MSGSHKQAFTFLEIMIGLVIIGLLASITIPNLRSLMKKDEHQIFVSNLNSLLSAALDNAVYSEKINRVIFDFINKKVSIEQQTEKKLPSGQMQFEDIDSQYTQSSFDFAKADLEFINFFIDTKDEMNLSVGQAKKEKVWFYILPDGTAQPVILNIIDMSEQLSEEERKFSLVLNPFTIQFKEYEKFMQPA
ncbi:hypothetical protein A3F66_06150 [candidate division TM6 bacterium RIFCSPHIGHO2_12_FULL_32_22]|nr:MAG: hypothetical protein A3F66_06150 [candidate division TM6 bacterium RIFCSPHIGHO2_12_FULL_32_22]